MVELWPGWILRGDYCRHSEAEIHDKMGYFTFGLCTKRQFLDSQFYQLYRKAFPDDDRYNELVKADA